MNSATPKHQRAKAGEGERFFGPEICRDCGKDLPLFWNGKEGRPAYLRNICKDCHDLKPSSSKQRCRNGNHVSGPKISKSSIANLEQRQSELPELTVETVMTCQTSKFSEGSPLDRDAARRKRQMPTLTGDLGGFARSFAQTFDRVETLEFMKRLAAYLLPEDRQNLADDLKRERTLR